MRTRSDGILVVERIGEALVLFWRVLAFSFAVFALGAFLLS